MVFSIFKAKNVTLYLTIGGQRLQILSVLSVRAEAHNTNISKVAVRRMTTNMKFVNIEPFCNQKNLHFPKFEIQLFPAK